MKSVILFYFLTSLVFSIEIQAQSNWKLTEEKENLKVYTQKPEGAKYKQLKIVANIKAPISEIVAALEDVNEHKNWVYETPESRLVEKRSNGDFDYYVVLNIPFPGKDRDLYIRVKREQDPNTKIVNIKSKVLSGKDEVDKLIRIKKFDSSYIITPKEGYVEVEYFLNADPAGKLPAWIVNLFTTKGPTITMESMIELVESGKYKNKNAEGIID